MLSVLTVQTEIGRRAFRLSAPAAWNLLQNAFFRSLNFKCKMKDLKKDSIRCVCFKVKPMSQLVHVHVSFYFAADSLG